MPILKQVGEELEELLAANRALKQRMFEESSWGQKEIADDVKAVIISSGGSGKGGKEGAEGTAAPGPIAAATPPA